MTKIHVSVVQVNQEYIEQHFDELVERLYPERKSRVLAFKRREPAYTSVVAGLLLQMVVKQELGIEPESLVLFKNQNGKPSVSGYPEFFFNLSHSGDYVVLAYGSEPVGIDIEQIREKNRQVAKRCFTQKEYEYACLDASHFFEIWTMKESYLKLTGQGISVPLDSFEVNPARKCVTGQQYQYYMKCMKAYWIAVCALPGANIHYEFVDVL